MFVDEAESSQGDEKNNIASDSLPLGDDDFSPELSVDDLQVFDFPTPLELLLFIWPHLNPHRWQAEEHLRIAQQYTKEEPLLLALCTCNSSGKDSYIVAPTVAWLTLCKKRHRAILTSASGTQLTTQTEQYIADIFKAFNARIGSEVARIRQRRIRCAMTGSEVVLFATDEAGKAEGFHPFADYKDAEMCIIVNEAKSVQKIIFDALMRCEGYSRWIEVSSPGQAFGHFYDVCSAGAVYPATHVKGKWYCRKITALDCPHISKSHIENMRLLYGEQSDLFRSSILAEFTSSGDQLVLSYENIRACIDNPPVVKHFGLKRAGLDLAAGGDENVLSVWWGNERIGQVCFKEKDTTKTANYLVKEFQRFGLKPDNIIADDGGVGRGILDQLRERGWPVKRVLNQSPALVNKREFTNRGAELWFKFARFVQEGLVKLDGADEKFIRQLATRVYKRSEVTGKITLEGKQDARLAGKASPDRADAAVLAFAFESLDEYFAQCNKTFEKRTQDNDKRQGITRVNVTFLASAPSEVLVKHYSGAMADETRKKHPYVSRSPSAILNSYYDDLKGTKLDGMNVIIK